MPDEATKTDGNPEPKPGTQTPGAKTATDGGDAIPAGVQARIDGLTAEKNRIKDQFDKLQKQFTDIQEQHKTEGQKQIDAAAKAIVDAEWKPKADRWAKIESDMKGELDVLVTKIPEDHRGAIDSSSPVEVQLRQARVIVNILEKKGGAITTAANPPAAKPAASYTREQWDDFVSLARTDLKKYNEMKEEMFAAAHEGRVAGLRNAV